jgi:TRAP-type C4-dicarboxylate transport system permease small subunit
MSDASPALRAPARAERREGGDLDRKIEPLRRAFRRVGLALLFVMIGLPALQVFLRGVLRTPFVGAEELARFMLICVVFITLPYVVSSGASIRMEEIISVLPAPVRRVLRMLITGTGAIAFGVAAYSVAVATLRNLQNATPSLGIPYWIFFSAAFLGLLLSAIESGVQFVKAARSRPLYVTFAEEQPPEEADLERVLSPAGSEGREA